MDIVKVIDIAEKTNQNDLVEKLKNINNCLNETNAPLVLPLVGEFSSGKTTLINALTDCKILETATTPTTATIYEIFFGNEAVSANVIKADGSIFKIEDYNELKNEKLKDASLVEVFDTSKRISPTTVLIDTPGLSSPEQKHKEVLLEFIPKADAILLVTDINQQITKSLVDFTKSIALTNRPIYLIITKCETKSPQEKTSVKKYILENSELDIKDIVFVSAKNNELQEVYELLDKIDKDKTSILKSVNEQRVKNIIAILTERIDELLQATNDSESLDEEIRSQKNKLDKLYNNIDKLINDVSNKIDDIELEICNGFSNAVFNRLDNLVSSNVENYDNQAIAEINGLASQYLSNYKLKVQQTVYSTSNERRNSDIGINLSSLNEINYSDLNISQLPYDINLNSVGHEYDGFISGGVKLLAVAGVVVAAVATAGAAAEAVAAAEATSVGLATEAGGAVGNVAVYKALAESADAALVGGVSVANNIMRNKELKLLKQAEIQKELMRNKELQDQIKEGFELVDNYDKQIGEKLGQKSGIIDGIVSKVTDKTGKPQRQRIIHNYIDDSLVPVFKTQLKSLSLNLIGVIQKTLKDEAESLVKQETDILTDLKNQKEKKDSDYKQRISELKEYKSVLLSL